MIQYPWLQEYINQWLGFLLNQKVPHALLLSGSKGFAKKELAQLMAHYAICESLTDKGPCQTCKGCQLYNSGNHTDIITITAEKEIIKVDQIRNLTKSVVLSSTRNQYKIMIIEDAEKMNTASANALLKTLEEPPTNVVLILTTSEISYLLPTIKSRCFKINLKSVNGKLLNNFLIDDKLGSPEDIKQAMMLANNSPLETIKILENNSLKEVKLVLDDLNQLINNQSTVLDVSKHWIKNGQTKNLIFVANYFLKIVKQFNGINQKGEISPLSNLEKNKKLINATKLLGFIRKINVYLNRGRTSLKPELLLEELLIAWKNDFQ